MYSKNLINESNLREKVIDTIFKKEFMRSDL